MAGAEREDQGAGGSALAREILDGHLPAVEGGGHQGAARESLDAARSPGLRRERPAQAGADGTILCAPDLVETTGRDEAPVRRGGAADGRLALPVAVRRQRQRAVVVEHK